MFFCLHNLHSQCVFIFLNNLFITSCRHAPQQYSVPERVPSLPSGSEPIFDYGSGQVLYSWVESNPEMIQRQVQVTEQFMSFAGEGYQNLKLWYKNSIKKQQKTTTIRTQNRIIFFFFEQPIYYQMWTSYHWSINYFDNIREGYQWLCLKTRIKDIKITTSQVWICFEMSRQIWWISGLVTRTAGLQIILLLNLEPVNLSFCLLGNHQTGAYAKNRLYK